MKKIDFIFAILFFFLFGVFGFLILESKKKEYSILEDRMLTSRPKTDLFEISSPIWFQTLETSFQEQFDLRPLFLEKSTELEKLFGVTEKNHVYFGKNGILLEQPGPVNKKEQFISSLNQLYQVHNDLNMSLLLLPSHITIEPNLVSNKTPVFDQYQEMKKIYRQIKFNTIDIVPNLKKGISDYEMYYHFDTRLTSYGAYYAYLKYAELNDIEAISINDFNIHQVSNDQIGNLMKYTYTFSSPKDMVVEFVLKKEPRLEFEDRLDCKKNDFNYQEPLMKVTNFSVDNKKELLILKDENVNVMIPFFWNHYYKVHVIDTNFYHLSISSYLKEHKEIKDVLFLYDMNQLDKEISNINI